MGRFGSLVDHPEAIVSWRNIAFTLTTRSSGVLSEIAWFRQLSYSRVLDWNRFQSALQQSGDGHRLKALSVLSALMQYAEINSDRAAMGQCRVTHNRATAH